MHNILKAKPLDPKIIASTAKYFRNKSAIFDPFDEVFLHIGMVVNKKPLKPSELVELAMEDIEFSTQDELMEHVSYYFGFHNSIVRFLDLLESVKDENELFKHIDDVVDSLYALHGENTDYLQEKVVYEAREILRIVFEDYRIQGESFVETMKQVDEAFSDKELVDAVADVLKMLEFYEKRDATQEDLKETMRYIIVLAMAFNRLRKENKANRVW